MAQASSYARGTGANPDGTTGGAVAGIGPNIQNWALGMTVTFPALELPSLRARKAIEQAHVGAEQAREQQIDIEIRVRAPAPKPRWMPRFELRRKRLRNSRLRKPVNDRHAHDINRDWQT